MQRVVRLKTEACHFGRSVFASAGLTVAPPIAIVPKNTARNRFMRSVPCSSSDSALRVCPSNMPIDSFGDVEADVS